MPLTITLGPLWCFDEGDGLGIAEPYIWPVFFKIDDEVGGWILGRRSDPEPEWFITPGGSHDNLPRFDAGDRLEVVRTHTFPTFTPLPIISDETAVGFVVVLLEEDTVPTDARINSAYAEFTATVRERVLDAAEGRISALRGRSSSGSGSGDDIAGRLRNEFETGVWRELPGVLTISPLLSFSARSVINRDDVIGAWAKVISLADLPAPGSFRRYGPIMWSSRNGSEDGRYALQARIDRTV
jgi:hypothetical protein